MQAFAKQFNSTPDDLDMHLIYDVSHNIAKVEHHLVDGKQKTLLVHRKVSFPLICYYHFTFYLLTLLLFQGSTRAFPPHHPLIPVDYQLTGQPVLIGGTMGTCSYILTGTEHGMVETFGSTCHGAVIQFSQTLSFHLLLVTISLFNYQYRISMQFFFKILFFFLLFCQLNSESYIISMN